MPSSLLVLLDDIATVLDDVSAMTKVAVKKTAGVLGDDLALNAKQVSGVAGERELPVVWAVAKGSVLNKLILVPAALVISWLAPWLVTPLLVVGGLYLCYEGVEKLLHRALHHGAAAHGHDAAGGAAAGRQSDDGEAHRIAGAIRTDFILSAEIVVIALGVVATSPPVMRVTVLLAVAAAMTVGVYGLVAGIVKLDDLGAWLTGRSGGLSRAVGFGILAAAPVLMRLLTVAGTAAMFLVGGGIVAHSIPVVHDAVHGAVAAVVGHADHGPTWAATVATAVAEGGVGVVGGLLVVAIVEAGRRLVRSSVPA